MRPYDQSQINSVSISIFQFWFLFFASPSLVLLFVCECVWLTNKNRTDSQCECPTKWNKWEKWSMMTLFTLLYSQCWWKCHFFRNRSIWFSMDKFDNILSNEPFWLIRALCSHFRNDEPWYHLKAIIIIIATLLKVWWWWSIQYSFHRFAH